MLDFTILSLLGEAHLSRFGLAIATSDTKIFQSRFYAARKHGIEQLGLPYEALSLRTSPVDPENEVWITKGDADA